MRGFGRQMPGGRVLVCDASAPRPRPYRSDPLSFKALRVKHGLTFINMVPRATLSTTCRNST